MVLHVVVLDHRPPLLLVTGLSQYTLSHPWTVDGSGWAAAAASIAMPSVVAIERPPVAMDFG